MLVRMLTTIGGHRNGVEWPRRGETLDVPDHEAADLIAARYAAPAREEIIADAPHDPAPVDDLTAVAAVDNVDPAPVDDVEAVAPEPRRRRR